MSSGIRASISRLSASKKFRRFAISFVLFLLVLFVYNLTTSYLARRWSDSVPRNPDTGIMIGAESILIGPEDAPNAVLLVHGFTGGSNNFNEMPQRLAGAGYRVHAMRLAGHGTSPRDFAQTSGAQLVESVLDEIRILKQKHERVFVVGHSMGGALSTIAASKEDIDGLIVAAPYYGVTYRWYYILPPEIWTKLTWRAVKWVYKSDHFIRVKRREATSEIFSYRWIPSHGSKTLSELGKEARDPKTQAAIDCPVFVILARDDSAADPQRAAQAFQTFSSPQKELLELDNSDHHVFWDYDREIVYTQILAFLNGLTQQKATPANAP